MYKVVEGLVPALPTYNFVKLARPKRNIKAKHFEDCITSNIVEKRTCNNTQGFELPDYKKQQYQPSFFVNINTSDCLIEVTAWAGLTVLIFLKNNSASILSWWSVLLAEETGVRRENH
jgi:hypothetical protein